jgi:hypothetical protein
VVEEESAEFWCAPVEPAGEAEAGGERQSWIRLFTNVTGNGPWLDGYISNIPPV